MPDSLESRVRDAFRAQADACRKLGSPFTARLCALAARRLSASEGAVAARILAWPGPPGPAGDSVPLRVAGALHALVLTGACAELAAVYPPHHAAADDAALWGAVRAACRSRAAFILERLDSAPQTNEVRRSGALYPGLATLAQLLGRPLVLSELGASAGLNLQLDRYRYDLGGVALGDRTSPVRIAPDWHGAPPPRAPVAVAARAGCDLRPIDPSDEAERLRLLSYVWADQSERLALARAALDLAVARPERVAAREAVDWLGERLARPFAGAVHTVFHSIAWQYFPAERRRAGRNLLSRAGGRATAEAPLAWLRLEHDGTHPGAGLRLTLWPGGAEQLIARADFHGRWVRWTGWRERLDR